MLPVPSPPTPPGSHVSPLSTVLHDDRAISRLIEQLLDSADTNIPALAAKLGINPKSLYQYRYKLRRRPSLQWVVRLVEACGGRVYVEWPKPKPFEARK